MGVKIVNVDYENKLFENILEDEPDDSIESARYLNNKSFEEYYYQMDLKVDNGVICIPEGIRTIKSKFFSYNPKIKAIVLPKTVAEIEAGALQLPKCQVIILNNGLERIKKNAFTGCEKLAYISIPSSVQYIGKNVFSNCSVLETIVFESPTPCTFDVGNIFSFNVVSNVIKPITATIYVPKGSKDSYLEACPCLKKHIVVEYEGERPQLKLPNSLKKFISLAESYSVCIDGEMVGQTFEDIESAKEMAEHLWGEGEDGVISVINNETEEVVDTFDKVEDDYIDIDDIIDTLVYHLSEYELDGVEITDEDAQRCMDLMEEGLTMDQAVDQVLAEIRQTLDDGLEETEDYNI